MSRISDDLGYKKYMSNDTLNSAKRISIFELKKQGYLNPLAWGVTGIIRWSINGKITGKINFELNFKGDSQSSRPYMQLKYSARLSFGTGWEMFEDKFELIKVPCPYGGARWFFKCENQKNGYCGKHVAILYLINGHFVCRHCTNLSYDSCNESKKYRGDFWGISSGKASEQYSKLKRFFYRGKPTRKYHRYLKIRKLL